MNTLDRHILKSVLFTCAGAVGLFIFVLVLGNAIKELLPYVLAGQLEFTMMAKLVALLVPYVIMYALPMGILTGVLLTLGRLSADSEITAMRAAGLSLLRIARPVIVLGVAGLALGLYVNFDTMPRARVQYYRELAEAIRANPVSFIVPRTYVRDFPGVVVYIGEKQGAILRDFWLWKLDGERRATEVVHAESGRFEYDETTNELVLTLTKPTVETRNQDNPERFRRPDDAPPTENDTVQPVASLGILEPVRLSLDRLFGRRTPRFKSDFMTYDQLQAEEARLVLKGPEPGKALEHEREIMKLKLVTHDKFTTSLSVLTFALIGVPLGIKVSRRETSANLGIALLLVLVYYFLTVMVKWLDKQPELRPDLLLWLPNLFLIALAVWLFRRVERA